MKILIVDDNLDKIKSLVSYIESTLVAEIYIAQSLNSARIYLKTLRIDLLILDMIFPERDDKPPSHISGESLIIEILLRKKVPCPSHILVLSAYNDALEESSSLMIEGGIQYHCFELGDERWKNAVDQAIGSYKDMLKMGRAKMDIDVCFQCALPTPEAHWLLKNLSSKSNLKESPSGLQYYNCEIVEGGLKLTVAVVQQGQPGAIESTMVATKILCDFAPKIVVMTGICAGIGDEVGLGDIIAASHVWDWQRGKFSESDGEMKFMVEPIQEQCSQMALSRLRFFSESYDFYKLMQSWDFKKPNRIIGLKIGPTATSSSVVASGKKANEIRDTQNRKMIGLEMEGYGFYSAVKSFSNTETPCIMLKSVCDKADSQKSDDYQQYCSHVSARFAIDFVVDMFKSGHL